MKKYLCHLWHAGGVKEFDTETGIVSDAPTVERSDVEFGWVMTCKSYDWRPHCSAHAR